MFFQYLFLSLLALSSAIILFQDFKSRSVSLWVLLIFGSVCISSVIYFRDIQTLFYNIISTTIYLGFIWLMLKVYLYLKFKKNKTLLDELMGKADLLVMFFIGLTFNTIGSVFFFCFAFIGSLLAFFIYSLTKKNRNDETIPLAGLLVFFYLSAIVIVNFINDFYLIDCSFINP
jgi:hypothetical protein